MGSGAADGGTPEEIPLDLVDGVDCACDRFESAWTADEKPRIEDYLAEAEPRARGPLLRELLLLELDLRRGQGESPEPEAYRARFPDDGDVLARVFGGAVDTFHHNPDPVGRGPMPRPDLPGYILLDEIGRGGMGVVYRARDVRLNRIVALKMVLSGGYAPPEVFARFEAEAETVARLQHPNVVRIHAVGEHDGLPYFDMEYVGGGSLADRLDGTPWPPRAAARLIEAAAGGVEAVHRLGVVHRDVKPGNILMADDGAPKLGDFGLAKSLLDDSGLTRTNSVLGSPSYMAPEQASGGAKNADASADVYSLGAVFYELLTGRPPFRAPTALETLMLVQTTDPVPPSRLVPGLPRDVETVCLKCLEKTPARRYASAGALADDLRRFLEDRPVAARRSGPIERAARWCRRNPWVAGLTAAVFVLLLATTVVSLAAAVRVTTAAAAERRTLYFARMNLVQQAWEAADVGRMRELLAPYEADAEGRALRDFEWFYWKRLSEPRAPVLRGHGGVVEGAVFSPDGETLATFDIDAVHLWDVTSAQPLRTLPSHGGWISAAAFSSDGKTLAVGARDGQIALWDVRGDDPKPRRILGERMERVASLAFLNARTLVSAHDVNITRTWDVDTGKGSPAKRGTVPPRPTTSDFHVTVQALSPEGDWLATAAPDGSVYLRRTGAISAVVDVNAAIAGAVLRRLRPRADSSATAPPDEILPIGRRAIRALAFSPDARTLAVGGEDRSIVLVDVATRRARDTLRGGHSASVWSLGFSRDGRTLASASLDNTVVVWDAENGNFRSALKGHSEPVEAVAVSPDGRYVASGSADQTVRLWDLARDLRDGPLEGHTTRLDALALSPDGQTLATGSRDGEIRIWNVADGSARKPIPSRAQGNTDGHPDHVRGLAFTPDGTRLISVGLKSPPRLWDAHDFHFLGTLAGGDGDPGAVRLSLSEGGLLAVCLQRGGLQLWNLDRGGRRSELSTAGSRFVSVALSPDGKTLVAGDAAGGLVVWELTDGEPGPPARTMGRRYYSLAFSPDGKTLAGGSRDGSLTLWDDPRGEPRLVVRAHANELIALSFTADGKTLASGGRDDAVRLWDVAAGALKTTLRGHSSNVTDVQFSRDGDVLASASLDHTARLWLAPRGGVTGPNLTPSRPARTVP